MPHGEHERDRDGESADQQPAAGDWKGLVHDSMLTAENARVRDGSAPVHPAAGPTPFE
jgi:hypothetical protein